MFGAMLGGGKKGDGQGGEAALAAALAKDPRVQQMGKNYANDALKNAMKTPREGGSFLFCIPLQVGPASPYARNVRHWMHAILIVQASVCLVRLFYLQDFLGGFWMLALCGLGWYAWSQDMNITYICIWGLCCFVNGVFDILGLILPLIFDVLTLQLLEILLRCLAPISELLGFAFAWHLYVDYYSHGGGAQDEMASYLGKLPDPMAGLVDQVDPEEVTSLITKAKKQVIGVDKHFDAASEVVGQGVTQGVAAAGAGLQGFGQQHWMQGFDGQRVDQPLAGSGKAKKQAPCC
mmetsp:Transcript_9107/g.32273  ORF Transcript_9107/g.32273 Transcript_9107/m.32273 type:complete len:292 (-) Transcript_9107:116-991(-)